jgi:L-lactate dehydrogenase complex protein LldG
MKQNAKEAILARIRRATADSPAAPSIPHDFLTHDDRDRETILEEFIDRLIDYKAMVTRCSSVDLPQAIATACEQLHIIQLATPPDVPSTWLPASVTVLSDDPPLSVDAIDKSDGVLTGCAMAIAQTGTIILDGGATQGRRVLSLIPDRHLCVVLADQVVGLVPEAITRLQEKRTQPITFISGPSATSDIELNRVEGVHGPRTLQVFVVADAIPEAP